MPWESADNNLMSVAVMVDDPQSLPTKPTGPLSPQHHRDLLIANKRATKILGAAKLATFNAWTAAIFSVFSLVFGLFSISGLLIGAGLAVVARNEFYGRNQLRQFDPRSTQLLGWNQMGFLTLLVAYSIWCIFSALTGPNPYEVYINDYPELTSTLEPMMHLHVTLTLGAYGAVIVLSVIFQGLNALYYFKRGKLLHTYLHQTPAWIVDLQRRSSV